MDVFEVQSEGEDQHAHKRQDVHDQCGDPVKKQQREHESPRTHLIMVTKHKHSLHTSQHIKLFFLPHRPKQTDKNYEKTLK